VQAGLLPAEADARTESWFERLLALLVPSVDRLDQLPQRAALIFAYDPAAAISAPDNAETLTNTSAQRVLDAFAGLVQLEPGPLSAERFKAMVNQVKTDAGVKGKELFHPIRVAITGSHSGPEFDRLIPLIEEGSQLSLPKPVLSVKDRVQAFISARKG
jgi:nondiscriminating glutamyl-tRNA synthetase